MWKQVITVDHYSCHLSKSDPSSSNFTYFAERVNVNQQGLLHGLVMLVGMRVDQCATTIFIVLKETG